MKKRIWILRHSLGFWLFLSLFSGFLRGEYIYKYWYIYANPVLGARALGLGNAFTAVADDGTAAFWNPAGIAKASPPQVFFSYRSDLLTIEEHESSLENNSRLNYSYFFHSRLYQIDAFSIRIPVSIASFPAGLAFSYYRYLPSGFSGSSQTSEYWDKPLQVNQSQRIDFKGSEGFDVLSLSAAVSLHRSLAVGVTLQNFFNSALMQFDYTVNYVRSREQVTQRLGKRNLIVGVLFRPIHSLTLGASYQTPVLKEGVSEVAWSMDDGRGNLRQVGEDFFPVRLQIPARLAVGLKIQLSQRFFFAYDYVNLRWRLSSVPITPVPFFSSVRMVGEGKLKNPWSHRLGAEYNFVFKRIPFSLCGGVFQELQAFSGAGEKEIEFRGFSVGAGARFTRDVTVALAYRHWSGRWLEPGHFRPADERESVGKGKNFTFSITYFFDRFLGDHR